MLTLKVGGGLQWNEETEEFVQGKETELHLEHSLRSISKWESLHCKPFFGREPKNAAEMLDYVRCMSIDDLLTPEALSSISRQQFEAIQEYIDSPMTATWFLNQERKAKKGKMVTSELVYFWMSSYGIDWQAQDWHFNRLMTLIRVCSEENKPPKKMPKAKALASQRALNAKRKKQHHTRG